MSRPTVHDIAREAGVSLATVDRVLNARPGVRDATITRVHRAIDDLGYVRDVAAANLARQRSLTLAFVLPDRDSGFLHGMRAEVASAEAHARLDRITIRRVDVAAHDPQAMVTTLDALGAEGIDGVAVMAPETPQTRDAIRRLHGAGVRVVTLASDLPGSARDHFVGINNLAAGRTAGFLMGRFIGPGKGRVMVLAGSMLARDHAERRLGFDQVLQSDFPGLAVLPTIEGRDDPDQIAALLPAALAAHSDIRGIYAIGAGNRGLIHGLRALGRARDLTVIAHELSPLARAALLDGTFDAVITQDIGHMIRSAVRLLRAGAEGRGIIEAQERIRIEVFLRENLP